MNTDFQSQWGYPSEIKTQIGAASYELRPLSENFRSGRPKWECLFFAADRKLVSRRLAMELSSKRTCKLYHVCARNKPTPPRSILRREQSSIDTDTLNDVYAEALGNKRFARDFSAPCMKWMFFPIVIISAVALYAVARQCCHSRKHRPVSREIVDGFKDL